MRMLRVTIVALILFPLCAFTAGTAQAQTEVEFGPGVGYDFDVEEIFLQAFFGFKLADLSEKSVLRATPSFDYFLIDGADLWSINIEAEVLFKLKEDSPIALFVGGGPGFERFSASSTEFLGFSQTDFVFHFRAGIQTTTTGNIVLDPHIYLGIGDGSSFGIATRLRFGNAGRNQ